MGDDQIDTSDIPEATNEIPVSSHLYYANSLKMPITDIHIMIDDDNSR